MTISQDGTYVRGPWFVLSYVYSFVLIIMNFTFVMINKEISLRERICYLIYIIVPSIGELLQMNFYGLNSGIFFSTVNINFIYVSIYLEKSKEIERKNEEIKENEISIMISQIKPHFLYNSLTAISRLCKKDSNLAEKKIIEFSDYLRVNMKLSSMKGLISFEEELKHTKTYLELEKMRFDERLNIVYDINVNKFVMPFLSLQPIVENAVRHGVTKKIKGGIIKISTYEDSNNIYIKVEYDGVGFDTNLPIDDKRQHIGINNVTKRIREQCNGDMTINSTKNEGTTVLLSIPKRRL